MINITHGGFALDVMACFQQQGYQHIEFVDLYPVCLCIPALNSFQSVRAMVQYR